MQTNAPTLPSRTASYCNSASNSARRSSAAGGLPSFASQRPVGAGGSFGCRVQYGTQEGIVSSDFFGGPVSGVGSSTARRKKL